MINVLYALLCFAVLGVVFGILLAAASRIFAVEVNEKEEEILACLPGANCGGCGEAGCAALAAKIASGERKTNSCPASTPETVAKISEIMGVEAEASVRMRAQVMCSGGSCAAAKKYLYEGEADCNAAMRLAFGDKFCQYSCIGLGTCVTVCPFGAISLKDGVADIDYTKCVGCGVCVTACPKNVIKLIPFEAKHWVGCSSLDRGPVVRAICQSGCIGCKLCEKVCEAGAITVSDSVAKIDYEKCNGCNACVEKCPRHIIKTGIRIKKKGENIEQDYIIC